MSKYANGRSHSTKFIDESFVFLERRKRKAHKRQFTVEIDCAAPTTWVEKVTVHKASRNLREIEEALSQQYAQFMTLIIDKREELPILNDGFSRQKTETTLIKCQKAR